MRLIFITLLLANAGLYLFSSDLLSEVGLGRDDNLGVAKRTSSDSASFSIRLVRDLSEVDLKELEAEFDRQEREEQALALDRLRAKQRREREAQLQAKKLQADAENSESDAITIGQSAALSGVAGELVSEEMCEWVGMFDTSADAEVLMNRFKSIEVEASVRGMNVPAGQKYQVYLPPEGSRKQAFEKLADLQSNGIDSYVIRKGELANSVSLGLFRRKSFAESHVKRLKGLGLAPEIDVITSTVRKFWVVVPVEQSQKLSDTTWRKVLLDLSDTERRQNFCLDVASG